MTITKPIRSDSPGIPFIDCILPVHDLEHRRMNVRRNLEEVPDCIRIIMVHDRGTLSIDPLACKECEGLISSSSKHELICGFFSGPGAARNAALGKITAEWVFFIDSDDRINFSELAKLAEIEIEDNVDLIVGAANIEFQGRVVGRLGGDTFAPISDFASNPGLWRLAFKSKAIHQLDFPNLNWAEDQVFIARFLIKSKFVPQFTKRSFYTYIISGEYQTTKNTNFAGDLDKAREIISVLIKEAECPSKNKAIVQLMLLRIDFSCLFREKNLRNLRIMFERLVFCKNPYFNYQIPFFVFRLFRRLG